MIIYLRFFLKSITFSSAIFIILLSKLEAQALDNKLSKNELLIKEEIFLIKTGKFNEAIVKLKSKIKDYPDNPDIYYYLGKAYEKNNNSKDSLSNYTKATEIDSNYAKPYMAIGLLKGKENKLNETIKYLDKAISLDPNYSKAFSNRGVAKGALEDNNGAIKDFNKAISINPLLSDAYVNRGITYELLGNLNAACSDWGIAKSLGNQKVSEWIDNQCKNLPKKESSNISNLNNELLDVNNELLDEIKLLKEKINIQEKALNGKLENSPKFNEIEIGDFPAENKVEKESSISEEVSNNSPNISTEEIKTIPAIKVSKLITTVEDINPNKIIEAGEFSSIENNFSKSSLENLINPKPLKSNIGTEPLLVKASLEKKPSEIKESISSELNNNSNSVLPKPPSQTKAFSEPKEKNFSKQNYSRLSEFGLGFFIASTMFLLIDKFKNQKKLKLNEKGASEKTFNNTDLKEELTELSKEINKKHHLINKLTEKELSIQREIKLLNLDIEFLKIKQSNLKVYCLSKYKNEIDSNNEFNINSKVYSNFNSNNKTTEDTFYKNKFSLI